MIHSRLSIVGRVIAAALMTTGIAAATVWLGPDPTFERPTVETISLGPDTVWFCGVDGGTPTIYLWIRSTREWRRAVATEKAPCADGRSTPKADQLSTMHPAHGLAIVGVKPPTDSNGNPIGRGFLRVLDSTNARTVDLRPKLDASLLEKLLTKPHYEVGLDTVTVSVGGTAVNDSLLWIGLAGGFAEGQGELGGVYRVDRRTGAYEFLVDGVLGEHTITGAASVGRWVWFATENPAEYGPYGDAGLLRLDGTTRQWRRYTDSSSLIPDALIRTMESHGRILALATKDGLAVIELRQPGRPSAAASTDGDEAVARWNVRYFAPTFVGDSLIFDVGSKAQAALSPEAQAPFMVARRFAPRGHERPLYVAAAKLPADRLASGAFADDAERAAQVLSDTSLVPVLLPLLTTRGDGQLFASFVLGDLGARAPKAAIDAMRAAFVAMDTVTSDQVGWNRARIGRVLTTMGDSTAVRWARATLDTAVRRKAQPRTPAKVRDVDATSAIEILGNVRDRDGLTLIMAVAPARSVGTEMERQIVIALANYDAPLAWGALIALGRRNQLPAIHTYSALEPSALKDPTVAARLHDFIREGIADSAGDGIFRASFAVEKLRLIEFAPMLVSSLQPGHIPNGYAADNAVATLVSLSGRTDSPAYADSLPPRSVHDWWQEWHDEQHGNLVPATPDAARKAVGEWYDRMRAARRR